MTHQVGFDYLITVPIDNDSGNSKYVDRENDVGIEIEKEYDNLLSRKFRAYRSR
jgi:hypothetical protein